ncbi:MAG: hypothetical protein ACFFB2_20200 [Promethearchaeota archaeon]
MTQIKDISSDEVFDAEGMVLMPRLVNTHTHLSITLFRGVTELYIYLK